MAGYNILKGILKPNRITLPKLGYSLTARNGTARRVGLSPEWLCNGEPEKGPAVQILVTI